MDAAVVAIEFGKALAEAVPALFKLFQQVGGRDAFLVSVDAMLTTARAKTDADLERKHRPQPP